MIVTSADFNIGLVSVIIRIFRVGAKFSIFSPDDLFFKDKTGLNLSFIDANAVVGAEDDDDDDDDGATDTVLTGPKKSATDF